MFEEDITVSEDEEDVTVVQLSVRCHRVGSFQDSQDSWLFISITSLTLV